MVSAIVASARTQRLFPVVVHRHFRAALSRRLPDDYHRVPESGQVQHQRPDRFGGCSVSRVQSPALHNVKYAFSWGLIGLTCFWPFILIVWIFAILIYLMPVSAQSVDFMFELFNAFQVLSGNGVYAQSSHSLQGTVMFICFGALVPSFRQAIRTCGKAEGRVSSRSTLHIPSTLVLCPSFSLSVLTH